MMKKITNLTFASILMCLIFTACQEAKEGTVEAAEKVEETTQKVEEAATKVVDATKLASSVLNVNLATEADLQHSGLDATIVSQIMEKRPFLTMNDLDNLLGDDIDKAALYKKLFIPFNLNTTAEADFKMIPGVGDRMAHEFEEYRPYTSIQQFRKEIGKYVDEAEIARYEKYVFVPVELNTATEADIKALPGVGDRMAHEFEEYRPYSSMEQFRKEIGKYVDDKELTRLERFVYLKQ